MLNFPFSIRPRNSIASRLALYILLYSSAITLVLTISQLYLDYRHELDGINNQFEQIRIASLPSIKHNLWVVNHRAIQSQLNDLLALPNMQYLEIQDENNLAVASTGTRKGSNIMSREFPLSYEHRNNDVLIGTLRIDATL